MCAQIIAGKERWNKFLFSMKLRWANPQMQDIPTRLKNYEFLAWLNETALKVYNFSDRVKKCKAPTDSGTKNQKHFITRACTFLQRALRTFSNDLNPWRAVPQITKFAPVTKWNLCHLSRNLGCAGKGMDVFAKTRVLFPLFVCLLFSFLERVAGSHWCTSSGCAPNPENNNYHRFELSPFWLLLATEIYYPSFASWNSNFQSCG